jgi:hypothetical protein
LREILLLITTKPTPSLLLHRRSYVTFGRDVGRAGEGRDRQFVGAVGDFRVAQSGAVRAWAGQSQTKENSGLQAENRRDQDSKIKVKIEAKVKTRTLRNEGMRHPTLPMLRSFALRSSSVLCSIRPLLLMGSLANIGLLLTILLLERLVGLKPVYRQFAPKIQVRQ